MCPSPLEGHRGLTVSPRVGSAWAGVSVPAVEGVSSRGGDARPGVSCPGWGREWAPGGVSCPGWGVSGPGMYRI